MKGYSGGLSRVWHTETFLGTAAVRNHVWSPDRASADAALDSAMSATKDSLARGGHTARVMQVVYYLSNKHRRGPSAICTLMNGTMPRIVMMHAEWENGELTQYLYRRTHAQEDLTDALLPTITEVAGPAYRAAYTDLLHTRLFGLCLRSRSYAEWARAVTQSGTGWPAYISRYLWKQVNGQKTKTKTNGGVRRLFARSDAGHEALSCED